VFEKEKDISRGREKTMPKCWEIKIICIDDNTSVRASER
jgi:hypothetical protein